MTDQRNIAGMQAALATLIVLQLVMLGSLYAQVMPHPPEATPLFGIAPFIGMALSASVAALMLGQTRMGRGLAVLAAFAAAVSFGPHKYFDAQFALIWPAVIAGQLAIAAVLVIVFKRRRGAPV
ncbi:hypothetical protein [uncultured Roseovarius sp.]|uniref:hypothetical protein n=1 Tax=uncultured Roseovarius sp. TaxID=293344 RepID=UPI0026393B9B|nr:hypothetical protein [uncultured Roseovarius sp.]